MINLLLLYVDKEYATATSTRLEMRASTLSDMKSMDIKMEYLRLHPEEIDSYFNENQNKSTLTTGEFITLRNELLNKVGINLNSNKVSLKLSQLRQLDEFDEDKELIWIGDYVNEGILPEELPKLSDFEFVSMNRYLVLGKSACQYVQMMIHLGPRGESFNDFTECDYLRTFNDCIFKFIYLDYSTEISWLTEEEYKSMEENWTSIEGKIKGAELKSGVSKRTGKNWYMFKFKVVQDPNDDILKFCNADDYVKDYKKLNYYKIIRNKEDISPAFNYFLNEYRTAKNNNEEFFFGLDYETQKGFPFDSKDFDWMGVSICDQNGTAAYFDMEWIQHQTDYWDYFKEQYKAFLNECGEDCITFNCSFEMRSTYLLFKKLYFFQEGSTINKIDGFVYKNFSLKWTAMRCLHTRSWDDDFEYISSLMEDMMQPYENENGEILNEYEGTDSEGNQYYSRRTYKNSDYWRIINEKYPGYEDEFSRLIETYWDPFGSVPSEILGRYCCMDSYNTVLLRLESRRYKDKRVWSYLNSNLVLGALLGIHGWTINEDVRQEMEREALDYIAWGRANLIKFYLEYYDKFSTVNKIEIPYLTNLFRQYIDPFDTKSFFDYVYDYDQPSGLDRDKMKEYLPEDLVDSLIDTLEEKCFYYDGNKRARSIYDFSNQFIMDYFGVIYDYKLRDVTVNEDWKYILPDGEVIDNDNDYYNKFGSNPYDIIGFEFNSNKYLLNSNLTDYQTWCQSSSNINELDNIISQLDLKPPYLLEVKFLNGDTANLFDVLDWMSGILNLNSPEESKRCDFIALCHFKYVIYALISNEYEVTPENCKKIFDENSFDDNFIKEYHNNSWITMYETALWNGIDYEYDQCDFWKKYHEKIENSKSWKSGNNVEYPILCIIDSVRKDGILSGDDEYKDFNNFLIERGPLFRKYEDKLKKSKAWKSYQIHKSDLLLTLDAYDEGVFSYTDKVDDGYGNMVDTVVDDPLYTAFNDNINPLRSSTDGAEVYDFLNRYETYYIGQEGYEYFRDHFLEYNISDKSIYGLFKLCLCNFASKKYYKLLTTYIDGQFYNYQRITNHPDENLISTKRYFDDINTPNTEIRVYSPFAVCQKQSKRWSAPSHTIPSKSEVKRILSCPPGYLLSYFDISGAEVRCISYMAKDKYMLDCYSRKVDPYINLAMQLNPGHDKKWYKGVRSGYKTILLGAIYGMGVDTMAGRANLEVDDCQQKYDGMFERMSEIKKLIEEKGQYCADHDGLCESFLGDKLYMDKGDSSRYLRLGINQVIQEHAAVSLADGFENIIHESYTKDEIRIRPANVVHDSSQNYFDATKLFEISDFYHKHLTEYLYNKYGIDYEFDVEIGDNYFDMCEISQLDPNTIELEGNYMSISQLFKKCIDSGLQFHATKFLKDDGDDEIDISEGTSLFPSQFKSKISHNIVDQCFADYGVTCRFNYDRTSYKVTIVKDGVKKPEQMKHTFTPFRFVV